ncbi:hypothetical protein BpHYR1_009272 [Brachionus plicatilis]|uniref:Uncharacterized protein n=1 Tax=Brachionus plicatilis TaxID=10195 RepID=A0A3M7Q813_BRAPC|nr:hypothetical protein BpHYR1_009272 [Brachionus plicatilis]
MPLKNENLKMKRKDESGFVYNINNLKTVIRILDLVYSMANSPSIDGQGQLKKPMDSVVNKLIKKSLKKQLLFI